MNFAQMPNECKRHLQELDEHLQVCDLCLQLVDKLALHLQWVDQLTNCAVHWCSNLTHFGLKYFTFQIVQLCYKDENVWGRFSCILVALRQVVAILSDCFDTTVLLLGSVKIQKVAASALGQEYSSWYEIASPSRVWFNLSSNLIFTESCNVAFNNI